MAATYAHICAVLPRCLADVVNDFLLPRARTDREIARVAHMELAAGITDFDEAMGGAAEADDLDMAGYLVGRGAPFWSVYVYQSEPWWRDLREHMHELMRPHCGPGVFRPLSFWHTRDAGLAIPLVAIPYKTMWT